MLWFWTDFNYFRKKIKMLKSIQILFVFLFTIQMVTAQATGQLVSYNNAADNGVSDALYLYALSGDKSKLNARSYGISGSAYTSSDFSPTALYYKDELQGNFFYRYNAYNEEIELKDVNLEDAPIKALARDKNLSIRINGNEMSFKTYIDKKGLTQNGYLEKLVDGAYSLYKRTDVKFTEGQKAQNSFVKAIPARFSKFEEYYLEIEGTNRIDEILIKNGKLIKLVPTTDKEEFKAFLKAEKLNVKNEEDLFKALEFLNK